MDMPEVEGTDMIEKQDHPTNHRLREEGMNMVGSNMVNVDDMDTVEEHFHPMNHRMEVEGMDTVEEHFHQMNHRPEVEGMDTMDIGMGEDRATVLEVVEREFEGVMLTRHWTGDGAVRHHQTHREWGELTKPGCSKDQPMFVTHDSNYSLP
jgi:putative IMPACT (imprinted ancient) family translation regulator